MSRARDLAAFVSNADGDVKFDTDTLFIDSSANRVGIGNTAPSRSLHITANPAMILLEDSDGGSNDKKAQVQVDSGAFEVNARNDDDSSRTDNILVADLGNGNVGIGDNSPSAKLEIVGSSNSTYLIAGGDDSSNGRGLTFTSSASAAFNGAIHTINAPSSQGNIAFQINGSEKTRITTTGITFNGDTAAANALNDYENGTWTPVFAGVSTTGTYTYTEQQGHYIKIGGQVTAWFNLTNIATSSTGSGATRVTGLPFTSNWVSGFNGEAVGSAIFNDFTGLSGVAINVQVVDNSTQIVFYKSTGSTNTTSGLSVTTKNSNGADVRGFVTYSVDHYT